MSNSEENILAGMLEQSELLVDPGARVRLLLFLDELLRWNRRINLTAITRREEALEKHLVDSLTVLPLLGGEERLLDIGSGGGFPGIPLKIARPGLKIVSIDSVQKKIAFQRQVSRMLGLSDFEPLPLRAEAVPGSSAHGGGFDVVVSRAFSSLAAFAALARPCIAPGGKIIAMKGEEGGREVAGAWKELDEMGLICATVHSRKLPASGAARMLIVLEEKKGQALKDISAPEVQP